MAFSGVYLKKQSTFAALVGGKGGGVGLEF